MMIRLRSLPTRLLSWVLFCGAVMAAASPAWADPPARVGRLMMMEGPVKFYADQEEGWQPARLNLPVTGENSIWTESRARAEWRAGPVAVRLDRDTVLDVQKLDDVEAVLYVQRGAVNIRIGLLDKSESWKIFTPEGSFTLRAKGTYRIESDPDKGESRLAVLAGRARVESRSGSPWIDAGRMALLDRDAVRVEPVARTDFDDWAQARDEGLEPDSTLPVSPYMTGYEDLRRYGTWEPAEEYGSVWYPSRVDEDWAPYRYGSWRYVRPWGWTWIDDSPWGFAPFHYGRWVQVRGRWAWWPGNRVYRPVYSPALVAWVGGNGWNINISSGSGPGIGWFPLAPWEAYVPWYSHSPTYVYNINHIHVGRPVLTRPPRDYRNFKPGVTVVPPSTFENRNPVWRDRVRNPGESLWNQRPVQEVNALPPRPAYNRPPQSKPAVLPPGSGSPGNASQAPTGTPMPLPQHEASPRGPKPTPTPRLQPGTEARPGAKPGVQPGSEAQNESMPSRPAPTRQPGASIQPGSSMQPGTQSAPVNPASNTPAPVYLSPRGKPAGEAAPVERQPAVERSREPSNAGTRSSRPERSERDRTEPRNEPRTEPRTEPRIERQRQEPSPARTVAPERVNPAPAQDRGPVERTAPKDKPTPERDDKNRERNADKGDRNEQRDKGERTQQR